MLGVPAVACFCSHSLDLLLPSRQPTTLEQMRDEIKGMLEALRDNPVR